MKRFFFTLGLLILNMPVFADTQAMLELQKRLALVEQYSADFEQTVRSSKGQQIQQGKGKFQVKRPNLFRLETQSPQENLIVSDGETLWFYDPFISQATANWVKDAVYDTPFVLLTNNDKGHWDKYDVTQNTDNFTLKPKSTKSNIKQFDVRIDAKGVMKGFSTIERDGQSNLYLLRNISNLPISNTHFNFNLPKDAELDDQRK